MKQMVLILEERAWYNVNTNKVPPTRLSNILRDSREMTDEEKEGRKWGMEGWRGGRGPIFQAGNDEGLMRDSKERGQLLL